MSVYKVGSRSYKSLSDIASNKEDLSQQIYAYGDLVARGESLPLAASLNAIGKRGDVIWAIKDGLLKHQKEGNSKAIEKTSIALRVLATRSNKGQGTKLNFFGPNGSKFVIPLAWSRIDGKKVCNGLNMDKVDQIEIEDLPKQEEEPKTDLEAQKNKARKTLDDREAKRNKDVNFAAGGIYETYKEKKELFAELIAKQIKYLNHDGFIRMVDQLVNCISKDRLKDLARVIDARVQDLDQKELNKKKGTKPMSVEKATKPMRQEKEENKAIA